MGGGVEMERCSGATAQTRGKGGALEQRPRRQGLPGKGRVREKDARWRGGTSEPKGS